MTSLLSDIAKICRTVDGWTSETQAAAMAVAVCATSPAVSVEIGVYFGRGLLCLATAHRAIGCGKAIGIDSYSNETASSGQEGKHVDFWRSAPLPQAGKECRRSIQALQLSNWCELRQVESSAAEVPPWIGVLRIDGNHGPQSLLDVQRFSPNVIPGGMLFLDDVGWIGGHVERASQWLDAQGWRRIFDLGTTRVYQR